MGGGGRGQRGCGRSHGGPGRRGQALPALARAQAAGDTAELQRNQATLAQALYPLDRNTEVEVLVEGLRGADTVPDARALALLADEIHWARGLMLAGAPLVHVVPGRAGWELRLVVQGGLRILDHIEALNYTTQRTRPALGAADVPVMLWRALRM